MNRQSYPISRRTDPASSHAAAREMERSGRRAAQCEAVLETVKRHPRRTSLELARLSQLDRYTVSRRLPELERRGLIRRGLTRDCTVNGRPMLTWEPVNEDPQQMNCCEEEYRNEPVRTGFAKLRAIERIPALARQRILPVLKQIESAALNLARYIQERGAGANPEVIKAQAELIADRVKEFDGKEDRLRTTSFLAE